MVNEVSATSGAEQDIPPISIVDKSSEPIDLSKITKRDLCKHCRKFSRSQFISFKTNLQGRYRIHPSVVSLQDSVRQGCYFCMFLWKQLGLPSASRYPGPR